MLYTQLSSYLQLAITLPALPSQVFLSYGDNIGNDELLARFGFVEEVSAHYY
jgi:hypothetical protein